MIDLARTIDHTLLKPEATAAQIDTLCDEARAHRFFSVCVNSCWVPRCVERLRGAESIVCAVVGFPLGAASSAVKAYEARWAVEAGAREVDMVVNLGELIVGSLKTVEFDIRAVVDAARAADASALIKVILETRALKDDQIRAGCQAAAAAGADFVKTSTGFHAGGGATIEHVRLMTTEVAKLRPEMRVKASGGIRDRETALAMLEAGASRLGTSSGIAIVSNTTGTGSY